MCGAALIGGTCACTCVLVSVGEWVWICVWVRLCGHVCLCGIKQVECVGVIAWVKNESEWGGSLDLKCLSCACEWVCGCDCVGSVCDCLGVSGGVWV